MKFKERLAIRLRVLFALLAKPTASKARILDVRETVDAVIGGRSLIRLGDGEFMLYRGLSLGFQSCSETLLRELCEIRDTAEETGGDCPYLLCVPNKFMKADIFALMKNRCYVSSWAEARLYFERSFPKSVVYGDAFVFSKDYRAEYERMFEALGGRAIIFVHNSNEYADSYREKYGGTVHFIPCPESEAYSSVDALESKILSVIEDNGYGANDVSVLISAGPCAKALVFRLCRRGYHAIDTGHCFDYPLEDMK